MTDNTGLSDNLAAAAGFHEPSEAQQEADRRKAAEATTEAERYGLSVAQVLYAHRIGMDLPTYAALSGGQSMTLGQYETATDGIAAERAVRAKATEELLVERAKAAIKREGSS